MVYETIAICARNQFVSLSQLHLLGRIYYLNKHFLTLTIEIITEYEEKVHAYGSIMYYNIRTYITNWDRKMK